MCRKRLEPFKCDYVPESAVVVFCLRNKILMQNLHDNFGAYLLERNKSRLRFIKSDIVKVFNAMVLLEFNYLDSTIASGSLSYRFVRIYRKKILKIDRWFPTANNPNPSF